MRKFSSFPRRQNLTGKPTQRHKRTTLFEFLKCWLSYQNLPQWVGYKRLAFFVFLTKYCPFSVALLMIIVFLVHVLMLPKFLLISYISCDYKYIISRQCCCHAVIGLNGAFEQDTRTLRGCPLHIKFQVTTTDWQRSYTFPQTTAYAGYNEFSGVTDVLVTKISRRRGTFSTAKSKDTESSEPWFDISMRTELRRARLQHMYLHKVIYLNSHPLAASYFW